MKKSLLLILGAALVFALGCTNSESVAPQDESLNFEVIGEDAPDTFDAAMSELAEMDIVVPDPVTPEELQELNSLDENADMVAVDQGTLDEGDRPHFRRIVRHLHNRFQNLHDCIANSDNRQLQRLAFGAHQAMRHGVRALENENPRRALELFHRANRMLNAVHRICVRDGGGRP